MLKRMGSAVTITEASLELLSPFIASTMNPTRCFVLMSTVKAIPMDVFECGYILFISPGQNLLRVQWNLPSSCLYYQADSQWQRTKKWCLYPEHSLIFGLLYRSCIRKFCNKQILSGSREIWQSEFCEFRNNWDSNVYHLWLNIHYVSSSHNQQLMSDEMIQV